MQREINFLVDELDNDSFLNKQDLALLEKARSSTKDAWAPYSGFQVAAAARLADGTMVTGTNQENASYPVGICAERTLLSTIGAIHPNVPIDTIAVTYNNTKGKSNKPVAPCGICRQSFVEYENRTNKPFRLILAGTEGKVLIIARASSLLPLSFSADDL